MKVPDYIPVQTRIFMCGKISGPKYNRCSYKLGTQSNLRQIG
jgi:hypothetical protein